MALLVVQMLGVLHRIAHADVVRVRAGAVGAALDGSDAYVFVKGYGASLSRTQPAPSRR